MPRFLASLQSTIFDQQKSEKKKRGVAGAPSGSAARGRQRAHTCAAAPLEPPRRAAPRRWRHASSTACRQAAPCRSTVARQHTSERARDLVLPAYMRMHMQRGQRTTCWQLNMTWDRAEACATRECLGERARAGWAGTIAPHRHSRRSSMPACMKDSGREKARARFTAHGSRVRDAPSCEVPSDGAGRCCGCMKALRV